MLASTTPIVTGLASDVGTQALAVMTAVVALIGGFIIFKMGVRWAKRSVK